MRREEKFATAGSSAREILAAWVCCGLIGVGSVLLDVPNQGRSGTQGVYAGVQIPGAGRSVRSDRSIADEFADLSDVPGERAVDSMLASGSADEPANAQQCWLRSVVRRLL
jgi:hypothetical protein